MMNDGATLYASYTYDPNGNALTTQDGAGRGRNMVWNSWNMPNQITGNKPATTNPTLLSTTPINTSSSSFQFVYNASHERTREVLPDGTTVYNVSPRVDTGIHVERRLKTNGELSYHYSLYAGSMPFGVRIYTKPNATSTTIISTERYYHTDHLGSIIAITDQNGAVVERRSFDAWGKRRNQNGTAMTNAFVTSEVRHAFTGHEDLGELGLIHMNGRLYDPAIGRFISADPTVQYPTNLQNYNRYSYINNNPLSATDPSGFGFLDDMIETFGSMVDGLSGGNKVIRMAATIAIATFTPQLFGWLGGSFTTIQAGMIGGFAAGAASGSLTAALKGAITGAAFASVGHGALGDAFTSAFGQDYGLILGHAFVGCGSSMMDGGSCGSGALAAGLTKSLEGPIGRIGGENGRMLRALAAAVVGGTASVIGGGKFANGAMTGAFSRLYNDEAVKAGSPALADDPFSPDSVSNRQKPPYEVNPQHSEKYLSGKDRLPANAQAVYEKAVRVDMGTWIGRDGNGNYYRYFYSDGKVHFSGVISIDQIRQYGYGSSLSFINRSANYIRGIGFIGTTSLANSIFQSIGGSSPPCDPVGSHGKAQILCHSQSDIIDSYYEFNF